ncbi:MAG: hypothetical protein Q4D85_08940 [Corynebacterium sp.]|uniref:hypothetical protein n=1 Tax=Corynebacterium sp. TaxID=1720 RepID=UPI0026DB887A|nr:hypothetical protein [Corynebacterium sp.]MDO5098873.1 hypothetical protein [Corynebacterium sp.]
MERVKEVADELFEAGFVVDLHQLGFLTPLQLDVLVEQVRMVDRSLRPWDETRPPARQVRQKLELRQIGIELVQHSWQRPYKNSVADCEFVVAILAALCGDQKNLHPDAPSLSAAIDKTDALKLFSETRFSNNHNRLYAMHALLTIGADKTQVIAAGLEQCRNSREMLSCILLGYAQPAPLAAFAVDRGLYPYMSMLSVPRRLRGAIVQSVSRCTQEWDVGLLLRYQRYWRQVFAKVHPYDVQGWEQARFQLDVVHGNCEWTSPVSQLDRAVARRDISGALAVAAGHPGLLVRRLRQFLVIIDDDPAQTAYLLQLVREVGIHAGTRTLTQAWTALMLDDISLAFRRHPRRMVQVEQKAETAESTPRVRSEIIDQLEKILDSRGSWHAQSPLSGTWEPLPDPAPGESLWLHLYWEGWDMQMLAYTFTADKSSIPNSYAKKTRFSSIRPGVSHEAIELSPDNDRTIRYILIEVHNLSNVPLGQITNFIAAEVAPHGRTLDTQPDSGRPMSSSTNTCVAFVIDMEKGACLWLDAEIGHRTHEFSMPAASSKRLLEAILHINPLPET